MITQHSKPQFKTLFFNPESRKPISLLCTILCYKNTKEFNKTLLGVLAYLNPVAKEITKLGIYDFPYQEINQQLIEFPSLEIVRYPYCLFFMFLCHNLNHFEILGLNMIDEMDLELLVF